MVAWGGCGVKVFGMKSMLGNAMIIFVSEDVENVSSLDALFIQSLKERSL